MTMQAARLHGREDLRVDTVPVPEAGPGEVLLRVKASALCGTDIRMFRNGARSATPDHPLVIGHEVSGVVEAVGAGVTGYAPGQPVAVAPNMGCGICDQCVSGNTQMCPTYRAFGINLPGGFASFMNIPQEAVRQGNLSPIPEGVDFVSAALVEPLSCVYNAFQHVAIVPGDTVLVIGAGPIGLMHAKVALMAGAARVYMNDLSAERLALCRGKEPAIVALPSDGIRERISDLTHGRGVSVCITAAPSGDAQVLALEVTGLNGRVMFFGGLPEGRSKVPLDTNLIHYRQLTVTGTSRQSLSQYRATLDLVASGRLVVKDLVTLSTPLDGIRASLDAVMQGKGLKNVVEFP